MLLAQKSTLLAAGVVATLLLACGAAVLSSQGASLPRPALQQPAQRVRAAAGPPGAAMTSPGTPLSAEGLSEALWSFGGDLLTRLEREEPGGNVFISPLSVASALGMAAAGTTPDSRVAAAFAATLRFDAARGGGPAALRALAANATELRVANSLWARAAILPSYKDAVSAEFGATAAEMPKGAGPVNAWVAEATGGKIKHLIDDAVVSNPLTIALLVNAVYFKAAWEKPFDPARTVENTTFRAHDGAALQCKMMAAKPQMLHYARSEAGLAVALPYAGGRFRAVLAQPSRLGAEPLLAMVAKGGALGELRAALAPTRVALQLPRFRLEYGVRSLRDSLRAMGLGPAFDAGAAGTEGPCFPLMTADKDAHLSDVLHKALLEVTEEGTVAAAATAAIMATRSMRIEPPPELVIFDRPFAIAIEDAASGAPLFLGLVAKPEFD